MTSTALPPWVSGIFVGVFFVAMLVLIVFSTVLAVEKFRGSSSPETGTRVTLSLLAVLLSVGVLMAVRVLS